MVYQFIWYWMLWRHSLYAKHALTMTHSVWKNLIQINFIQEMVYFVVPVNKIFLYAKHI